MRSSKMAIVFVIASVTIAKSTRAADGPLLIDLIGLSTPVQAVVPRSLVREFRRYVSEEPGVASTAEDLIAAARAEIDAASTKYRRLIRDGGEEEVLVVERRRVDATVREIEKRLRSELRTIAPTANPDPSDRFERAWRRTFVQKRGLALAFDPQTLLRENGLNPDAEPFVTLIASYERELDDLTCKHFATQALLRKIWDSDPDLQTPEMKAAYTRASLEMTRAGHRVVDCLRASTVRFVDAVPEPVASIILDRTAAKFAAWHCDIPSVETSLVKEVRRLNLDDVQRAAIEQIEREAVKEVAREKRAAIEAYLRRPPQPPGEEVHSNPFSEVLTLTDKLKVETNRKVLALLTPQQYEAYQRSPVLDDPHQESRPKDDED